jgi:hypothetical protein
VKEERIKMKTHFASVAEAAAYMYDLGFSTVEHISNGRIMEDSRGRRVRVYHKGFLDVEIIPETQVIDL